MINLGATRLKTVKEFINLKLSADQFNLNADTVVAFVEDTSDGLSVSSNKVTLKAGVTYAIAANFRLNGAASGSSMHITIRDFTNNVNLGRTNNLISLDNPTDDGAEGTLFFIIKPTTDIDVGFRATFVNPANQGIFKEECYATILSI